VNAPYSLLARRLPRFAALPLGRILTPLPSCPRRLYVGGAVILLQNRAYCPATPPPTLCRWSGDSAPEPGILSSHAPADFMSVERRLKSAGETPALLCPSPRFGSGVKMRPCRFAGGRLYCGLTANSLLCAGLARCNAKRLAIRDSRDRLYRRYFPLAFSRRAGRYVPEKFSKR